jgi:flavorubredoxin
VNWRNRTVPQPIAPGIDWISLCQDAIVPHAHLSAYLIRGEKSMLVDTAAPMNQAQLLEDVQSLLGSRPLDYLFVTHAEVPHMGNAEALRATYPDLTLASGNPQFIFPTFSQTGHYVKLNPGDSLDLGGRHVEFVQPFLQDLPNTLWLYDNAARTLLAADAFAYSHTEGPECNLFAEDLPRQVDSQDLLDFYIPLFPWLRWMDTRRVHAEVDRVFDRDIDVIGPAHGKVTRQVKAFEAIQKEAFARLAAD